MSVYCPMAMRDAQDDWKMRADYEAFAEVIGGTPLDRWRQKEMDGDPSQVGSYTLYRVNVWGSKDKVEITRALSEEGEWALWIDGRMPIYRDTAEQAKGAAAAYYEVLAARIGRGRCLGSECMAFHSVNKVCLIATHGKP